MSGFCGWFGETGDGASRADALGAMAARLPDYGTCGDDRVHGERGGLTHRGRHGEFSWHAEDGIWVAVEGHPRWTDSGLRHTAARYGHGAAIASAFRGWGAELLHALAGDFALAVIDETAGKALLAIDRNGIRTLSYAKPSSGPVVFGSTVDCVAAHPAVGATVRLQSIFDYVNFVDRIPAPHAIFEEQTKLLPGECVLIEGGNLRHQRYWRLPYVADGGGTQDALGRELYDRMQTSVRRQIDGEAPGTIGAFLSGGLDSSSVVGLLAGAGAGQAKTFTITFDDSEFDESKYARIAAQHFKTDHHEYRLTPDDVCDTVAAITEIYDEPFGNSSAVPTFHCARVAREAGIELMLAGDGGDELFAGNSRYLEDRVFQHYARIPRLVRGGLIEPMLAIAPTSLGGNFLRRARNYVNMAKLPIAARMTGSTTLVRTSLEKIFTADFLDAVDPRRPEQLVVDMFDDPASATDLQRCLAVDMRLTLADSDLRKVNRMCEAAGVRVRYPMLDDDLVEFSGRVPERLLLGDGELRHFYKKAFSRFLPNEIITKKKHGFGLPFIDFVRSHPPLREMAGDSLSALKSRGYFSPAYIDALTGDGEGSFGGITWDLMILELWLQKHTNVATPAREFA
jgi:asparagine synthase (glutamine-hydrolysing)